MSAKQYLRGVEGRYLPWECVSATFNGKVEVEQAYKQGRCATISTYGGDFEAEVDLKNDCDIKEFTSRSAARNWCERLIKKDIECE